MNTMYWLLVFVTAFNGNATAEVVNVAETMALCFEQRDEFMLSLPENKESFEVVCIKKLY